MLHETQNGNGGIALRASRLKDVRNLNELTIGEALLLKHIFDLSDSEAVAIFFGGKKLEDISA